MQEKVVTGASDWRSDAEKDKSYLRTASMSLFKTWIPEHPEASVERDLALGLFRQAMDHRSRVTFVSTLSTGIDDIFVHEYLDVPLSMQELLVQREGTEAFLDPRNALRVVRRKYGMMTMITRMTGTMEHRNIVAISLDREIDQRQLTEFARIISARIIESSAEEEQTFRKALARGTFPHIEVLFHSEVVGRRIPVPWEVKQAYALAGRAARAPGASPAEAGRRVAQAFAPRLSAKALRQLALFSREMTIEFDMPGVDPAADLLLAAHDDRLLAATRNLFDEYQDARRAAIHQRALGETGEGAADALLEGQNDFLSDAEVAGGTGAADDMLRVARALDRIRSLRGREFFGRISMVSGDVNFESAAMAGSGFESVELTLSTVDPIESLKAARKVVEPFYRAKSLAAACLHLLARGRDDDAREVATEALAAARQTAAGPDMGIAYAAALQCLLAVRSEVEAGECLRESVEHAHQFKDLGERVSGLMRVASVLMEAAALPPTVRASLSRHILGKDVHFWGKPEISPALVEAVVSLLPGPDDDTLIFLQKVVAHPKVEVRCSVIRTMPLGDNQTLRNVLLSHLKDKDSAVRIEVMERIGWAGDRTMSVYLVTHARHAQEVPATKDEKRALALNMARLDGERQLAVYNMFLGHLSTEGPGLTDKAKPFKDDTDWQLAGLEVLYHLNGRNARRLLFNAAEQARKRKAPLASLAARCWAAVKSKPYGEPTLPRSPHDPDWSEEDRFDLVDVLDRLAPAALDATAADAPLTEPPTEAPPEVPTAAPTAAVPAPSAARPSIRPFTPPKEGLLSRLKRKLFGGDEDEAIDADRAKPSRRDDLPHEAEVAAELPHRGVESASADVIPVIVGPPPAALRFQGCLYDGTAICTAPVVLEFALYDGEEASSPIWRERIGGVASRDGNVVVHLGLEERLPAPLPNVVWLGLSVEGRPEMRPRARLSRARSVVQG